MAKKTALLAIGVLDQGVRLSLIGKTMTPIGSVSFSFRISRDQLGLRTIDPFELVYFIRSGIQQLVHAYPVIISTLGISVAPGFVMAWSTQTCTPLSACYTPNNELSHFNYQEFKFSKFYSLLNGKSTIKQPNFSLNLWALSKQMPNGGCDRGMISGLDTWLAYLISGYNDNALVSTPSVLGDCLINDEIDKPLLKSLGLSSRIFPKLGAMKTVISKQFFPLDDGIPIAYAECSDAMILNFLSSYTKHPIAFVQLSHVNQFHVANAWMDKPRMSGTQSIRFSSGNAFVKAFGGKGQALQMSDACMSDITDALAIPLDPFRSFLSQSYHLLNVVSLNPKQIQALGAIQTIFLIKYMLAKTDASIKNGHIHELVVSVNEWPMSALQLCVDTCQLNGISFKLSHWLDCIHAHAHFTFTDFFSGTIKPKLFQRHQQFIPMLDPLTCYALYQGWEDWFNKLYDYWA